MSNDNRKALDAAAALAKEIALPSWKGNVFLWNDGSGDRIVVCADPAWLAAHEEIPALFEGLPVERRERLLAIAQ